MKESISYSFLLNIIILFIVVCASIVAAIFSYYRAFRASTIIINEIEKYEGYNCESKASIARKLSGVSYSVPFNVSCKSRYGTPCEVDETTGSYVVISYNIDNNTGQYAFGEEMNSSVSDGSYTKTYQYGVYTYMYIDAPVISEIIRIPIFSKTKQLHEFRNLKVYYSDDKTSFIDLDIIPEDIKAQYSESEYASILANYLLENYTDSLIQKEYRHGYNPDLVTSNYVYDLREAFKYIGYSIENAQSLNNSGKHNCGYVVDWSKF